ncbi:zinc-finger domain-containing protein, partial [Rhizobium ruizarguesonis]
MPVEHNKVRQVSGCDYAHFGFCIHEPRCTIGKKFQHRGAET